MNDDFGTHATVADLTVLEKRQIIALCVSECMTFCTYQIYWWLCVKVNGFMTNTGHSVIFYTGPWYDEGGESDGGGIRAEDTFLPANIGGGGGSPSSSSPRTLVNITGGPLSYRYQFHEIHIHYGMRDDIGSEHTIDGYSFPAEVNRIFSIVYLLR
jgi:hypothetical protein